MTHHDRRQRRLRERLARLHVSETPTDTGTSCEDHGLSQLSQGAAPALAEIMKRGARAGDCPFEHSRSSTCNHCREKP
jgi:hypothetical protein